MFDMKLDKEGLEQLENKVDKINSKALPIATQFALNKMAMETRKQSIEDLDEDFTVRNKWTQRGMLFQKVDRTLDIKKMKSEVGSIRDYMRSQQEGFYEDQPAVPQTAARTSQSNRRPIARPNRFPNFKKSNKTLSMRNIHNERQYRVRAVQHAIETNQRFLVMTFNKKKGIYKVVGGKKGTKWGWPENAKTKLMYHLEDKNIWVPKRPWLEKAAKKQQNKFFVYYQDALQFQLNKISKN